jgi:outer membrane protein assembly factor BamB
VIAHEAMKHNNTLPSFSILVLSLLLLIFPGCLCIYEDEIGLADWYQPHIGKIRTAFFVPPRQVIVATESAVLAALNVKTGDIMWRQVLPHGTTIDKLHYNDQNILIVSGRRVSVWSISDEGNLRWEEEAEGEVVDAKLGETTVSIATKTGLSLRSLSSGASLYSSPSTTPLTPSAIVSLPPSLYAVHAQEGSLQVTTVSLQSPYTLASSSVSLPSSPVKGVAPVITSDGHAILLGGSSGKLEVLAHSLKSSSKGALSFPLDSQITQASLELLGNDSFVVRTPSEQWLFRPKAGSDFPFQVTQKLPIGTNFAAGGNQAIHATPSSLHYSNRTGTYHHTLSAPSSSLFLLSPSPYLLVVGQDWRASAFSLNTLLPSASSLSSPLSPIWEREEALAAVVKTEMVELPHDVTDLNDLVREFEGDNKSIADRILGQLEHVKHIINNLENTLRGLVDLASTTVTGHKRLSEKELVTKDRFGFRKVIVALTASGKVFGISTHNGEVIWGRYLQTNGFSSNSFVYMIRTSAAYPPEIVVGDATVFYKLNPISGELISTTPISTPLLQVIPLPFLYTQSGTTSQLPNTHILMLVHAPSSSPSSSLSVSLFPESAETTEIFQKGYDKVHFFIINKEASTVTGYSFPDKASLRASVSWNVTFGQETIAGLTSPHPHDKVYHPAAVLGDRNILPKYINKNLLGIATVASAVGSSALHIYVLDTVTGSIVFHTQHADCGGLQGRVPLVLMENSLVYTYWNTKTHKHQMSVIDMYTKTVDWYNTHFSSYTAPPPVTLSQSYVLPSPVSLLSHTSSARGITAKHLLLGLASDSVVSLDKRWADARRPLPSAMTAEDKEENLIPYYPRLYFPPPTYVTYNKTIHRLQNIVTSGSSLESTTLVLAVGLDLFFTRISPAEAYDILTSDFNYPALILTITVLCVATFVTSRMIRRKDTLRAWK